MTHVVVQLTMASTDVVNPTRSLRLVGLVRIWTGLVLG